MKQCKSVRSTIGIFWNCRCRYINLVNSFLEFPRSNYLSILNLLISKVNLGQYGRISQNIVAFSQYMNFKIVDAKKLICDFIKVLTPLCVAATWLAQKKYIGIIYTQNWRNISPINTCLNRIPLQNLCNMTESKFSLFKCQLQLAINIWSWLF